MAETKKRHREKTEKADGLPPDSESLAPKRGIGRPRIDNPEAAETLRNAALELFASKNYATITVKDLAQATGLNVSLIYYYFGSKEGLFLKIVEETVERVFGLYDTLVEADLAPDIIISRWLDHHIVNYPLIQKLVKISMDYASTHGAAVEINDAIRRFYRTESEILRRALKQGVAQGLFRDVDADAMATFISTFLDGAMVRSIIIREFQPASTIEAFRSVILANLLQADVAAKSGARIKRKIPAAV